MPTTNFKIDGLHCKSCKTLIEEELKSVNRVTSIEVDHLSGDAKLDFDGDIKDVYKTIEGLGYKIATDTASAKSNKYIIPGIAIVLFIIAYILIQKFELFDIMSQLNESSISYGVIFIIGLLASFHCIGMCGGLVLTYSISNSSRQSLSSKDSDVACDERGVRVPSRETLTKLKPHIQYNLGRLISYTIIGGILGGFGSFFGINPNFAGTVTLIAAVFMILMGISLFSEHRLLNKIKLSTPEFIAKFLFRNKHNEKPKGPFIIGILTGFMPCGPLQAMQLFALASGSMFNGAIAMFLYSLGTIPLMLGFGTIVTSLTAGRIKQLMKFSGILVIILGIMMINRGITNFGYGINMSPSTNDPTQKTSDKTSEAQIVNMDVTYNGYSPNVIHIKKDVPVKWIIKDKGITGCTNAIKLYLPSGPIEKKLIQKGETIIEFTPTQAGVLKFSCWMSMVWGKFIVE